MRNISIEVPSSPAKFVGADPGKPGIPATAKTI